MRQATTHEPSFSNRRKMGEQVKNPDDFFTNATNRRILSLDLTMSQRGLRRPVWGLAIGETGKMAAGRALLGEVESFQGRGLQTQNEKSAMDILNHFWSTAKLAKKGDQILALLRRIFSHQSRLVSGHVLHLHAGFTERILGSNECILNVARRSDCSILIEN